MRIVRYELDGRVGTGVLEGDVVRDGNLAARLDRVTLLAPCEPRTIVCVGSNYPCQVAEKGRPWPERPALFLKTPNSVIGPGRAVERPSEVDRLEYEGELAVVIGRRARDVREDDYAHYVLGYTCANDVTAHDWRADGQWARAKSADTFCPLGPWIETEPPGAAELTTRCNGEEVQRSGIDRMIFGIGEILAYVTRYFTLSPGDVVLTGSPAGVGPMADGDRVTVEIDGVGALTNPVTTRTKETHR
ncbi:fumarylacetoacetate hydrolase family protein [Amycolatopsis sp. YIM 10]|uniref:fumarylacetoacetate hydrolase family protein n=1 Tax=Amycolatopsis sp. YIM 10 TaxID=2653857 RepID=UPI0012904661|nr:fumarylacetoacetate hydrolase family protein [Amycolatopsis sp. YIM 10]QFU88452.1 Ureidoglycolate lyase [Amycolatopsis sp. YIM 10]